MAAISPTGVDRVDPSEALAICRTALEQIARLLAAGDATVLLNGQRTTADRAVMLIIHWALLGITPSELLLCEPAASVLSSAGG